MLIDELFLISSIGGEVGRAATVSRKRKPASDTTKWRDRDIVDRILSTLVFLPEGSHKELRRVRHKKRQKRTGDELNNIPPLRISKFI